MLILNTTAAVSLTEFTDLKQMCREPPPPHPHLITFPDGGHIWTHKLAKMRTTCAYHLVKFTLRGSHITKATATQDAKNVTPACGALKTVSPRHLLADCRLVCHIALPQAPLFIVTYRATRVVISPLSRGPSHLPKEPWTQTAATSLGGQTVNIPW